MCQLTGWLGRACWKNSCIALEWRIGRNGRNEWRTEWRNGFGSGPVGRFSRSVWARISRSSDQSRFGDVAVQFGQRKETPDDGPDSDLFLSGFDANLILF